MKGDSLSSSSWIPRSTPATVRHQQTLPDSQIHLNSSSSQAPDPSSQHSNSRGSFVPHTIANSFRSVFQRNPHRAPSAASLHSSYSDTSSFSPPPYSHPEPRPDVHPYAAMVAAPLPVVSSRDMSDDEDDCCPVCLEPLSFSFRLPGEKPHIVPECGHSLHEVCISLLPSL